MFFASDNTSGAHPKVMEAVMRANAGYAMPYGSDPIMDNVRDMIRARFEAPDAAVYLVATGSAANALSLACLCPPWATIFAHRNAHIEEDECGAPEFFTGGAKITLLDGDHARMTPDGLRQAISHTGRAGVHNVQRGALSITNATEAGAVYSPTQVSELAAVAHAFDLPVHMDGARFANALVSTNATPAEMTWRAGVDVLSFGGTKNGCMGVEAVVIFDPEKHNPWEFELRRKRGGHLFSKHRFLSAQMEAYLTDDLWLDLARHANAMATRLSQGILEIEGASLMHPTMGNQVFARWPRAGHRRATKAGAAYYFWPFDQSLDGDDAEMLSARLVPSWSTSKADVDAFLDLIG
ncbi:low specificity L-threonine aldolase [Nereida sp. MMG025]|uniref:threonine aldolase family protein n=1 Tax=Nereida sp. MMG025 TaxID=2909981 RepID=UPI001F2EC7D0|nr:low specificity L-threonine aldolase [Nereida sp. MMG025]MCF6444103.1 low specificity L-threonine aldolase [Nereida sp. MMG025]